MRPADLQQFMPNVDFGDDVSGLPELPLFTTALRKQMQREVVLYNKPVLSAVDDQAWGWLYLILARHEEIAVEGQGLDDFAPSVLPYDSRVAVEGFRDALRHAEKDLRSAMHQKGVTRLLGSTGDQIRSALEVVEVALNANARRRSGRLTGTDDDGIGLLEYLLAQWWQRQTGRPPSLSKSSKRNGDLPAYLRFLQLAFSVLSSPPEVTADVINTRRKRYAADRKAVEAALHYIRMRLSPEQ